MKRPPQRILIVDDNEENLYFLRSLLRGHGYEVEAAPHGAAALELARNKPPDLIISDILMPVMDGFTLCREWRSDPRLRAIPLIFYTATYTDERDRDFALSLGAARFIIKPAEPEALLEVIRETFRLAAAGASPAPSDPAEPPPAPEDAAYLKRYNETLIRKLEAKMEQLERTNRELARDIAARQFAEVALHDSEGRFRSLVEAAPEGIFVQSEGRFIFLNPAMLRLLGAAKPEDLLGTEFLARVAPEYHETIRMRIQFQRETRTAAPIMDQEYLRLDGSRFPVETTAVAVRFQGRDAHLVFVRDITERLQLEEQLHQAQKMESVGRLAGGVAHDYNNMLGVILGYAELALAEVSPAQPLHADLQEIQKAARRSADLTRQLLAFARKQTIAPMVLDLNATVEGMLKMLQRLIGEDIDLAWLPGKKLWLVRMDPSQIDQILANLCVNARDAIAGVGKISIETDNVSFDEAYCAYHAGFAPGDFVLLVVSDDGCGMDREVQAHLFEPFYTTKEIGKGTGLGLATVYGIVKQNNGFINVYSEPGKGTTFRIYLPRLAAAAAGPVGEGAAPPASPNGTETVLVVEDERAVRVAVQRFLTGSGYTVLLAATPEEALRLAAEHSGAIHLLITDVVMPGLSGRDLAERLAAARPEMKCLFMSGYTSDVIAHRGILDEGVNFLGKPFSRDDLARKVREILERK